MAEVRYNGSGMMIIHEKSLHPDFFDLKTRVAGEILQKFSNYRMQLAIVGDFSVYKSKSLSDFIRESNRTGTIYFVGTIDEALIRLIKVFQFSQFRIILPEPVIVWFIVGFPFR